MNIKDEIIKQTNGGLDIFVRLYGQAVYENAMGSKKAFCQGTNDKNPSCHMVKKDLEWKLINYGEDGKPLSAIDCWMDEFGLQFREALYDIVDKFYINISLNKEINKPKSKEFVNAMPDEKLGDFNYKERGFTQEDINVWGSVVNIPSYTPIRNPVNAHYTTLLFENDISQGLPHDIYPENAFAESLRMDYLLYIGCSATKKISLCLS